jgi:lactoylglutathione lyase
MLSVEDLAKSLRFYRDILGGQKTYQFPAEGEPAFVMLRFGESDLGLGSMQGAPIHGRRQRPASGHRMELCVYIAGVDAVVETLRAAGTPVVTQPADMPWGERIAYVSDPDGNLVMLTQSAPGD